MLHHAQLHTCCLESCGAGSGWASALHGLTAFAAQLPECAFSRTARLSPEPSGVHARRARGWIASQFHIMRERLSAAITPHGAIIALPGCSVSKNATKMPHCILKCNQLAELPALHHHVLCCCALLPPAQSLRLSRVTDWWHLFQNGARAGQQRGAGSVPD